MSISQWRVTYNHTMEYYIARKNDVDAHLWTWVLIMKDDEMRKAVLVWFHFYKKMCEVGLLNMHTQDLEGHASLYLTMIICEWWDHAWVLFLFLYLISTSNLNTDCFYNRNKQKVIQWVKLISKTSISLQDHSPKRHPQTLWGFLAEWEELIVSACVFWSTE